MTAITFKNVAYHQTAPAVEPEGSYQMLDAMNGPRLVALHNEVATVLGRKTVNRFPDLPSGQRRTWDQLQAYAFTTAPAEEEEVDAALAALTELAQPEPVAPAAEVVEVLPESTEEAVDAPEPTETAPAPRAKREKKARPALKQDDGMYVFNMAPRPAGKFKTIGGRRPELMDLLRKGPTFAELMAAYKPRGDDLDQQAFNMATAVTCMCHVIGCGVVTEGGTSAGRIIFHEAL